MKKKMIVLGIISMVLLTGTTVVSAVKTEAVTNSEGNYNFKIEDVTYAPDPNDNEVTVFTINVSAEGLPEGGSYHPLMESRVNGLTHDMIPVMFTEDGLQICTLEGYYINFETDHVEIEVDCHYMFPETDEEDNLWELNGGGGDDDGEPDFIVEVLKSSYDPQMEEYVLVEVSINNIGGSIKETIIVDVKVTLDSNEETLQFPYLGTGPCESKEVLMEYDEGTSPHSLTAVVDPDNVIVEDPNGGEYNNVKSISVKSHPKPVITFLEKLINKFEWPFPVLSVLLWALSR